MEDVYKLREAVQALVNCGLIGYVFGAGPDSIENPLKYWSSTD